MLGFGGLDVFEAYIDHREAERLGRWRTKPVDSERENEAQKCLLMLIRLGAPEKSISAKERLFRFLFISLSFSILQQLVSVVSQLLQSRIVFIFSPKTLFLVR